MTITLNCGRCGGSGGGPDPELYCPVCQGRGTVRVERDEDEEERRDDEA